MKPLIKQLQSRFFTKNFYCTLFILILIGQLYSSIGQTVYNVGKYKLLRLDEIYFDITSSDTVDVTTNHMLIKLKEGLTENEKQAFNSRFPITPARTLSSGTILYDINQYTDFIDLIDGLSNDPDVHMYDINHLYRLTGAGRPNDSDDYITWDLLLHHPNALWPYEKTNLFDAWLLSNGSDDIIVAAIDNGLWVDHPDIATGPDSYSNIWYNHDDPPGNGDEDGNGYEDDINGWNFTENNNNLLMQNWNPVPSHGTRMTSIIAAKANNEIGIWGAAGGYGTPGVKVMMLKCNQSNSDTTLLDEGYIALAIDYAADKGARIINMPFCGWNSNENLEYLINYYYAQKQVVFLAATGNNKQNSIGYPARYENVIAVGATECDWDNINSNETRWINYEWASNYGPGLDIVAPGGYFRSGVGLDANLQYEPTYLFGTSDPYTGNNLSTSNAVSFASGVVALLLSAIPCLENHEVDEILKSTAYKLPGYDFVDDYNIEVGYGRIDALAALKYFHFQDITGEETWDYDRIFSEDIIINSGDHLIISNCTIAMSAWAKILVEADGKLTLDHCTITGLCGKSWPGIEVWGDNTASQHPLPGNPCAQGKLILKNGATIENAVVAVELWKPGDYSTTGGIIDATDSYFRNNVISVHALWYRNFNPADPNSEMDYYGTFTNCSFIIDDDYLGDKTFYKHVDLERVRGLKFYGCDFSLEHEATNVSQWNHAIAAYNAGFHVLPVCTSSIHPCPEYDSCRFNGFGRAIGAFRTTATVYPILINSAHFNDNSTGIFLSNSDYAVVINNFIKVGYDAPNIGNCGFANGVGIDIHTSNGFAVENNRLRKNSQAAAGTYAGIRVASCPSVHDIIYKNELTGLSYGNYAQGTNRSFPGNDGTGIEYQCNDNAFNAVDFMVIDDEPDDGMIRGPQGSRETPSGNVFSKLSNSWDVINNGWQTINWYYYHDDILQDPTRVIAKYPYLFQKTSVFNLNNCPDHYGGGGQIRMTESERMDREVAFVQNLNDFNSVKYLYESLVDGGNSESVLSDIQAAEPGDMWALRSQLLYSSPHLSQEVLRAVAERTDVFPDGILLEILSANPDELKRDTLLSYLEQKDNPLPQYMIEILRQALEGVTYKTILLDEMARYHAGKTQAAQDLIRDVLFDTVFNPVEYRNRLGNMNNLVADRQIIGSYLSEKDTASAMTLLNLLPLLYDLEGESLEDYDNYKTLVEMQVSWITQGKMTHEPDSLEIPVLLDIAEKGSTYAGNLARNILEYANVQHYYRCLPLIDTAYVKHAFAQAPEPRMESQGLIISAKPNPGRTYVAFDYELPDEEATGNISISDVTGRAIHQIPVKGKAGQKVWNTSGVTAGMYYYTLKSSGMMKSGKILIY